MEGMQTCPQLLLHQMVKTSELWMDNTLLTHTPLTGDFQSSHFLAPPMTELERGLSVLCRVCMATKLNLPVCYFSQAVAYHWLTTQLLWPLGSSLKKTYSQQKTGQIQGGKRKVQLILSSSSIEENVHPLHQVTQIKHLKT